LIETELLFGCDYPPPSWPTEASVKIDPGCERPRSADTPQECKVL
jgi:hypothetical protein